MATERIKKGALMGGAMMTAVASALCGGFASSAKAAPVTFAQYQEAVGAGNSNLFNYTETGVAGSGGSAKLTAVSVPVTFSYGSLAGLPLDLQGPQAATLTLTSQTSLATTTPFGGFGSEPFNTVALDTLTITRNTPAAEGSNPRTNLLTMTFTGNLIGFYNGFAAQLTGQTTNGATINYSSDFLSFAGTVNDYSLNFTSWISSDSNGLELDTSSSGFYQTATAASTGIFDSGSTITVAVPEPTTLLAAAGLSVLFLRRRQRSH